MKRVMRRRIGCLVAVNLLLVSAHALADASSLVKAKSQTSAQPSLEAPSVDPQALFTTADRDRDGSVSFNEFATVANQSIVRQVQKRFAQLDLNHDGRCTRAEVNKMSTARFARFDLNRDGAFTLAELSGVMKRLLSPRLEQLRAALDRDHDGRFSVAELTPVKKTDQKVAERAPTRRYSVAKRDVASLQ
jgi:Ca2+-binding EF-hand superfamily protein